MEPPHTSPKDTTKKLASPTSQESALDTTKKILENQEEIKQNSQHESQPSKKTSDGVQSSCGICKESLPASKSKLHIKKYCDHQFHTNCIQKYLQECFKSSNFFPTCPDGCKTEFEDSEFAKFLTDPERPIVYREHKVREANQNPSQFTFCSNPKCGYPWRIPDSKPFTKRCVLCDQDTCLLCKVPGHGNDQITCEEYQTLPADELAKLTDFVKNGYKRCPECMLWFGACSRRTCYTCSCGSQCCWCCGKRWEAGCYCMTEEQIIEHGAFWDR